MLRYIFIIIIVGVLEVFLSHSSRISRLPGQLPLQPVRNTLEIYTEFLWSIPLENTHSKDLGRAANVL
jgi:hypothetical protein